MPATCLALFVATACAAAAASSAKRPVSLTDLLTLRTVEFLDLSPDGRRLAYQVDDEIFVIQTERDASPQSLGKGSMPLWSPTGAYVAFYSEDQGTRQLFSIDTRTGHRVKLTDLPGGIDPNTATRFVGWSGDARRFAWSPDEKMLVFASQVRPEAPKEGTEESALAPSIPKVVILNAKTPEAWTLAGLLPGAPSALTNLAALPANELFLVDIQTKTTRQLTDDRRQYFNPNWAPDSRSIVCASSEGRTFSGFGGVVTNIYVINVDTRESRPLTSSSDGIRRLPSWSPDGRAVAFIEKPSYMRGLEVVSVVPVFGGSERHVTASVNRSVQSFAWTENSSAVVFPVVDGVTGWIGRSAIKHGSVTHLAEARTQAWTFAASGDGTVAWEDGDARHEGVIRVLRPGRRVPETIVDVNPQIENFELGAQSVVRWKNTEGAELDGILITPPGYRQGRPYPVIVDVYSGRRDRFQRSAVIANQSLAARGYVVFLPNHRGPHIADNYKRDAAHHDAARGPQGGDVMLDDVMSGVDVLVQRGVADPKRIGLHGYSNGATAAMYLLTRTSRFAVAAVTAGFFDWLRGFFLTSNDVTLPKLMGGRTPWTDLRAYSDLSAPYHADRITTPLLLTVGDRDYGRALDHVMMYNALRRLGRPVTLVRYPEEGHSLSRWALDDYWRRVSDLFDSHLRR